MCLGNMNNNFFALTRYLRDIGYDAELRIMNNEPDHFAPENDSYTKDYEKYTKKIKWSNFPSDYKSISKTQILHDIQGFDYIIGCGAAPAYLNKVGKRLDLFIPYGSDLDYTPFIHLKDFRKLQKILKRYRLAYNQRKGIECAEYILFDYTNDDYEKVFKKLKLKGHRIKQSPPFLYLPEYILENVKKYAPYSQYYDKFKELSNRYNFIAFHHSGHWWKNLPTDFFNKGTDQIIYGFKKFVSTRPDALLVFFEYGGDIEESKKLVRELQIEQNVAWFPKMSRKEIMIGLAFADVCIGEIARPWIIYGTIVEAMVMRRPLIMNQADKQSLSNYKHIYRVQNAKNSDDVAKGLEYYYTNMQQANLDGIFNRKWVAEELIEKSFDKIVSLIEAK